MFTVITGPMFAGKTTALIEALAVYPSEEVVVIKPSIDNRYTADAINTHNGKSFPSVPIDLEGYDLLSLITKDTKVVVIDELNFFSFDRLYSQIEKLLEMEITVIGGGLSYDFHRQPFGATLKLAEKADKVITLTARCDRCGKAAIHSYRKTAQKEQVVVGEKNIYGACCEDCYPKVAI